MKIRLLHLALCIAAVTLLGGCASNCNILSSSNSRTCNAMLMGGMIIAAPIGAPVVLISDAVSDAKARRMAREWHSSMETRLADNDIEAIQECLQKCDIWWQYELDYMVRLQLQLNAAQRFVAGEWHQLAPEDDRMYRLLAHYALSWQPESAEQDAPFVLVPDQVTRSYELLQDQAVRPPLQKLFSSTRYTTMVSTLYGMRFAIDTPADDTAAATYFNRCPDDMADIMWEEASFLRRVIACSRAYSYRFREPLPEALRTQWSDEELSRGNSQAVL